MSSKKEFDTKRILRILKKKMPDLRTIWSLPNDYDEYEFSFKYGRWHIEKDKLTKAEFKLIKEWLENENN